MRIVFIGAGSFRFSLQLLRNFAALAEVISLEVWLVDIDKPLLDCMTRILKRIVHKYKLVDNLKAFSTTDRREALEGADVVILSISIGQQASEWFDIHVPLKFGIPQSTGDACGPGGVFRSLRCVPAVNSIVRDMVELCPDATLFNYTNPIASIVLGANQASSKVETIGICHELLNGMQIIYVYLRKLGRKSIPCWENIDIRYSGVNHFAWLFSIEYQGEDLYPLIRENANRGGKLTGRSFNFKILEKHGYYPYPGARHLVEFIPEYFNYFNHKVTSKYYSSFFSRHVDAFAQVNGIPTLRNVSLLEWERRTVLWFYRQMAKGRVPCPGPSLKGERAIEMIIDRMKSLAGVFTGQSRYHPINVLNKGNSIVSNLPENCVVETAGYFKDGQISTTSTGNIPAGILNLVRVHAENTRKYVDAAVSGDPGRLLVSLLADPACQFIEDEDAVEDMMWNMLHYEQQWLPAFKESIPSSKELRNRKHFVDEKDLRGKKRSVKVQWPPHPGLRSKACFPHQ